MPTALQAMYAENLARIDARIASACAQAGRHRDAVRLLPVSKTVPAEHLRCAYAAGCRWFGENKVQEADGKADALQDLTDLRWSIIGHLQTNKAKQVARFAHEFQALDSVRVAEALERHLQVEGRGLDVLLQVNTSGEASKSGVAPADVVALLQALRPFSALRPRGLMTIPAANEDEAATRAAFALLRTLRDRLRQHDDGLQDLSMGMSGDFEWAIAEGATIVRIGTTVFGARPPLAT